MLYNTARARFSAGGRPRGRATMEVRIPESREGPGGLGVHDPGWGSAIGGPFAHRRPARVLRSR